MRTAHHESPFQKLYNVFKLSIPACIRHHGPGLPPEVPADVRGPFPVRVTHDHGRAVLLVQVSRLTSGVRYWPEISPEPQRQVKVARIRTASDTFRDDGPEKKTLWPSGDVKPGAKNCYNCKRRPLVVQLRA